MIHRLRRVARNLSIRRPFLFRASGNGSVDIMEKCFMQSYHRLSNLKNYVTVLRVRRQLVATKMPDKLFCSMKIRKENDGKFMVEIIVKGEDESPRLDQLEAIKNDFLGESAYFITVFHTEEKLPFAVITHCIGDELPPGL